MSKAGMMAKRNAIARAYPEDSRWQERVEYMPENQVIAIYNRFLSDGVFNKLRKPRKVSSENRQFTLEDYGIDLGVRR